MAINYDDVLRQLQTAGLITDSLVTGKIQRCKVEGDGERRGWYSLHEVTLTGGDEVIVGAYGIWYGDNPNAQRIELRSHPISDEQKAAIRQRMSDDRKRAEGIRKKVARDAADKAERKFRELAPEGEHDYLTRKGIAAHGVRFAPAGTTIDYETDGKVREVDMSHALAIPMCNDGGQVWGIQWILSRAHHADRINRLDRDKEYWPQGVEKEGKFHWLGGTPDQCYLVGEGYSTGASPHEATALPVACAFDAGNLMPVGKALRKKYKRARPVYLADDDAFGTCPYNECGTRFIIAEHPSNCPGCGRLHKRVNTGVEKANAAALATDGIVIVPKFADEAARRDAWLTSAKKLTDFNDLHALEGLAVVRAQIEDALDAAGIQPSAPARREAAPTKGGGGNPLGRMPADVLPVTCLSELLERFALIYGEGDVVFDRHLRKLVKLKDVQNITLVDDEYKRWTRSPDRAIALLENVGFDPIGTDTMVTCNTYRGWPTVPKEGDCEMLLECLWHICSDESNAQEVYTWLLKWLAYPIQHPGAKMQSAVVIHGKQGTGKTLFFKAISRIYGDYGLTINQSAVENPRNVWLASRLFVLAEEVIARKELHHVKNALKDLITGDTVYVDPKFVNPYAERNHVNLVFLSNETMPVVLEDDDRRHLVIWTPDKKEKEFYLAVDREIESGGIAALHHHLATLPLGDFSPYTEPPMTSSKAELIDLSLDSTTRFWNALVRGEIEGIRTLTIALTTDLYQLYRYWCGQMGVHPAPEPRLLNTLRKKHDARMARKRWDDGTTEKGPHGMCLIPEMRGTSLIQPEKPEDQTERQWLSKHVKAFRSAVADYRGGGNA